MSETVSDRALADVLSSLRESLGAMRARFYVLDPNGFYRASASIGFPSRSGPPSGFDPEDVLSSGDPLLEWLRFHRKPVYANSPRDAGPLAPIMEKDYCARMLAAPVYVGSRLAGVLELRDKAHGAAYTEKDLAALKKPLSELTSLLKSHEAAVDSPEPTDPEDAERLFFQTPGPSEKSSFSALPPPPPLFYAPAGQPAAASEQPSRHEQPSMDVSEQPPPRGHPLSAAFPHPARPKEPRPGLTGREVSLFHGFSNALLLSADVEAVVFSFWTSEKVELYLALRRDLWEPLLQNLLRDLETALSSAAPNFPVPRLRFFHTERPLGRMPGEVREFAGVQTSVVSSSPESALLFTLLFGESPSAEKKTALHETHRLVRLALRDAGASGRYRSAYRSFVNAFLEPGVKPYGQLKAHSLAVGLLCRRFATALRLSPESVEQVTVAGLLHDIGLRELELPYERISGRRPLGLEDLAIVRRHALAGEGVLKRIEFPYPVAPLVRHHHERFDGTGYPDGLSGEKIPLGSRIIALAEAYDAMTSSHSYRAPVAREEALRIILDKGGTQFDPDLTMRFLDLMRLEVSAGDRRDTGPPHD